MKSKMCIRDRVCEYKKEYSEAMGIIMCGDYDGEEFEMEYYFPYLKGSGITSYEAVSYTHLFHINREKLTSKLCRPRKQLRFLEELSEK